jgi:hypothetical protein
MHFRQAWVFEYSKVARCGKVAGNGYSVVIGLSALVRRSEANNSRQGHGDGRGHALATDRRHRSRAGGERLFAALPSGTFFGGERHLT